jgi:hypothetical protein
VLREEREGREREKVSRKDAKAQREGKEKRKRRERGVKREVDALTAAPNTQHLILNTSLPLFVLREPGVGIPLLFYFTSQSLSATVRHVRSKGIALT